MQPCPPAQQTPLLQYWPATRLQLLTSLKQPLAQNTAPVRGFC
jgi:hypothetical protein